MANILFIGLGNMGHPMAGHLANAGHALTVANRSPAKVENWLNHYEGKAFDQTESTLFDAIILCVGNDQDVEEWLIDKQLFNRLKPSCPVIDHTTTSADLAERMSLAAQSSGHYFCDVPVSGGQQGAINGQLSLMCGAETLIYDKVKQLTQPYTRAIDLMGAPGCGQKTKMVNQICVAGLVQALSEGMNFASQAGLDVKKVMGLVSKGAGGSWQLDNRHQTMIDDEYDHGFAIDLMLKDLNICMDTANNIQAPLPVTKIVKGFYESLSQSGHGRKDTSALLIKLQEDTKNS